LKLDHGIENAWPRRRMPISDVRGCCLVIVAWLIFAISAVVIAFVGSKMTAVADRLADRTGWGEAIVGATLLGAATSLPGITASVTAAIDGRAQMALSNAIGGIAAQTMFLALADLAYRKANLEHAAASLANMLQATLLVFILSMLVFTMVTPAYSLLGVHPVTPVLFVVYFAGLRMINRAKNNPMWKPKETDKTEPDVPDEEETPASDDYNLWVKFGFFSLVVVAAGIAITKSVTMMVDHYDWLEESIAGAVMTAVATSLPELVTSIAAVRRGALTLAVGGIIGGNCFDTLFAAVADLAYREGSIYHAAIEASTTALQPEIALMAASIAMTTLILSGLLFREKQGPAKIGFESVGIIVIYIGLLVVMAW
jgi:cation:H+ antiporter